MATGTTHEEVPLLPPAPKVALNKDTYSETSDTIGGDIGTPSKSHQYSLFVAICFSLNYSIGSGILGLPYEYFESGYVLASILLIYLALLTYITYTFVMDSIQRAGAITSLSHHFGMTRQKLLTNPEETKQLLSGTSAETLQSLYGFNQNEYQLSELIGLFCGKRWRVMYDLFYGIGTIIALWSYCALFGISLTRNIGIPGISDSCDITETHYSTGCRGLYSLYVCVFWIWTMIITSMDFTEQACIQIFATIARIGIISLMIFTAIGLLYSSWFYDGEAYVYTNQVAEDVSAWKWSGMAYMFAVCSFAFGNQYCVTDIINPLSIEDRNRQHQVWSYSVIICCVVYLLCGIVVSVYYGESTESPCTLAWKGFMGFTDTDTQPVWAAIVSWIIILFPAIDIGSAYPLNGVTLANTLEAAIIPQNIMHRSLNPIHAMAVENTTISSTKINTLFRVLVCTATAILALIEWDFNLILSISGAFTLLAVYGGPCVLEWKSREYVQEITNHTDLNVHITPCTKAWTSHRAWLFIIIGTSVIAFIAIFIDVVNTYV